MPGIAERLAHLPGFAIDQVAAAAGDDPEVLRMENLDSDLRPCAAAIAATSAALVDPRANSYLPFTGARALREAVALRVSSAAGRAYDPDREVVITCGGTEGVLDALLATVDPGDEVVLTDPTYAGLIQRVRLAGATPRLVPLIASAHGWRLDTTALAAAVGPSTRALLIMSPSMPTGCVLDRGEWDAIAEACRRVDAWLLYDAAMERIVFDGLPVIHPATLPGMSERTITIGSASKEQRMIGWRVGWVVGPEHAISAIARAHIYNAVTATGLAQAGATAALAHDDLATCVAEWQRRRDLCLAQLEGLPAFRPDGGWSFLLDVRALGLGAGEAAARLLSLGKVAATPMTTWGEAYGDAHVRFVYSREPIARLSTLGARVRSALV